MFSLVLRCPRLTSFTQVFRCFAVLFFHLFFSVLGLISLTISNFLLQLLSPFYVDFTHCDHSGVGTAFEACRQSSK